MSLSLTTFKIVKIITRDYCSATCVLHRSKCKFNQYLKYLRVDQLRIRQSWHFTNLLEKHKIMQMLQGAICIHTTSLRETTNFEKPSHGKVSSKDSELKENGLVNPQVKETLDNNPSILTTARFKEAVINAIPRKKEKLREGHLTRERNFLTAIRAMSEFLLKPTDLEGLRKTKRRSPFENEPPITVFWRRDVEAKASEVWGSLEKMENAKKLRDLQMKSHQEYYFNLKKILRLHQKETQEWIPKPQVSPNKSANAAGRVVLAAVCLNGINFVMKLAAWVITGSHSMFAEALHSFADVTNQVILAYGIHKSRQEANLTHPYGYTTMRYVASLVSGAMIFCVGSGLSVQHGISGLMHPSEVVSLSWAFYTLGCSLVTEGATLLMAVDVIRKGAKANNVTFFQYVLRGNDPSVNVVLLEDFAALVGVGVAMTCMGLTSHTGSHVPDAIGSCIIGGILACVSGFIVYTNSGALVGRSIPQTDLQKISNELEADVMIRGIHDVKGIDMGSGFVRYKAEVDFDGRALTGKYLEKQDISALFKEVRELKNEEDTEAFMLKHGENIVDSLGAEVDRIEKILKKKHPEIRHCDLEML